MKGKIVFPRGQFDGFEAICELLIGHQCLIGFVGSHANQRNSEIVGEQANNVQNDSLLAKGTGEERVNFVDNQHANFELVSQSTNAVTQGSGANCRRVGMMNEMATICTGRGTVQGAAL